MITTTKNPLLGIANGFGDIDIDQDIMFLDNQGDPVRGTLEIHYTPGTLLLHVPSVQQHLKHLKTVRGTKEGIIMALAEDILDSADPFFLSIRLTVNGINDPDVVVRWQWQKPSIEEANDEFPEPTQ